jgi:AMP nucleosidase
MSRPVPVLPSQKPLYFTEVEGAMACVKRIYEANTEYLRDSFRRLARGEAIEGAIEATYPYVAVTTSMPAEVDVRTAFGYVPDTGRFETSLTRPDIFERYYREQFAQLLQNHGVPLEIGASATPIPIHFAFSDSVYVEGELDSTRLSELKSRFTLPDLSQIDDAIANGTFKGRGGTQPLSLFPGPRVDYSLHRLRHYTGTDPACFQKFVIFTNYQFYVEEFVRMALEIMAPSDDPVEANRRREYSCLVEPGGFTTYNGNLGAKPPEGTASERLPQMPAYHLMREDGCGISIVNIGVGPSNARNISDHVAVLRPHAWIMLGHCAGLRREQRLGDYVLAHGYVRDDHALDQELPLWVPVPALAEVQLALEQAVSELTNKSGLNLKSIMRTGTVVSTDNRNWEISGYANLVERFSQSRAIALDMESATIAANGFRFRVPYGTLLCVSDKPLHGEIKLPGMANRFYRQQVDQHLAIGIKAMEILRLKGSERIHSRKLRGFAETAFR